MTRLSPHEAAHVAQYAFAGVPATDPRTGLPNMQLAVAIPSAESDYDTDAIATSSDELSANYGQTDHGLYQISGRWNAARESDRIVVIAQTEKGGGAPRLVGMGDWRDPYDNARMARALFDEWWRKENAPAYMAEKRAQDPSWQPSGWGAWSVYNGGSAWKATTTTKKNRHLERARFGLTAPIPAPRPFNRRGPSYEDPVVILQVAADATIEEVKRLYALITEQGATLRTIRGHFT